MKDAIESFATLTFDLPVARLHAQVRAQLMTAGTPVGDHDLLIAATALFHGHAIATLDLRSFPQIPGLQVRTY